MHEILEQLEINQTFFIQFGLFAFFFVAISSIYLKPFQHLLEKRTKKLKDDVASSEQMIKSVEAKMAEFESALLKVRAEASAQHEAALAEVRAKEDAEVAKMKEEIKKDYLKTSIELQEEKLKIESELKMQAGQLSDMVAQKIISGN